MNGDKAYLITDKSKYHYVIYPYEGDVYSLAGYNEVDELVETLETIF